jgi:cbb3-type cytochrome oxidase subunit 3
MAMSILFWGLVGLWLLLNGVIAVLLMRRKRSRSEDAQPLPFLVLSRDSGLIG